MNFKEQYNLYLGRINNALQGYASIKDTPEKTIYKAMNYSLTAGGKRLRPVLALAVCDMLGRGIEDVIPYACAVEMIHTYSLIHDDLPAMDNDDYRRGRLTNHKVFGEAMAILAGDALLNFSFEIMVEAALRSTGNLEANLTAMRIISNASGASGMIGGQVVDLESEGKVIHGDLLKYMHQCKTGALIKAPILAAAAICEAKKEEMDLLERYACGIGLAFQIKDDILDVEGDSEKLGKTVGSDEANGKSTFVALYGLEQSKKMLEEVTKEAVGAVGMLGDRADFLVELAYYLVNRDT
ncbi:MAG: polyprenyl synthetase family protein [Clostridia bacterium]|nr:polyprenyl synthetase family protein [Clostridia bacterium]